MLRIFEEFHRNKYVSSLDENLITQLDEENEFLNYFCSNNTDQLKAYDDIFEEADTAMISFVKILSDLENVEFFDYQNHLLNIIIETFVQVLYYKIWSKYQKQILKRYGIQKCFGIVGSISARREGKTFFIIACAVAMAISCPPRVGTDMNQGIVSLGINLSKEIVDRCIEFLNFVPEKYKKDVQIEYTTSMVKFKFANGLKNRITAYQTGDVSLFSNTNQNINHNKSLNFINVLHP